MTADEILALRPEFDQFLHHFDGCFVHDNTRNHLPVYVHGQLSDLPRKSVEPIALAAGMPPKTLQQFLSLAKWDHVPMRDRLPHLVASRHHGPQTVGIFDETGCPKKGDKTPAVQHHYCGATGKKDHGIVTVHRVLADGQFHCLLDSELFLPEAWSQDRGRCRAAGIPEAMVYRPPWQIALELDDIARSNRVSFAWISFDEGDGGKPGFLGGLVARGQRFVGEVPGSLTGWIEPPRTRNRPYRKGGRGRGRRTPRLTAGSPTALRLKDHLLSSPALVDQPWRTYHVTDTEKGPMVWEVKRVTIVLKDENDLPGLRRERIVARNVLPREKVKYFVSDATPATSTEPLLLAGFTRWRVERSFEDSKMELGFDHWEGRSDLGLKRPQIVSAVSYLMLAQARRHLGGEKAGADRVPGPDRGGGVGARALAGPAGGPEAGQARITVDRVFPAAERQSA